MSTRRRRVLAGGVLVTLALALAAYHVLVHVRPEAKHAALQERFEEERSAWNATRYERPPHWVRAPLDGDALELATAAVEAEAATLRGVDALTLRETLTHRLGRAEAPEGSLPPLDVDLASLRAASAGTYVSYESRFTLDGMPLVVPELKGMLLLLIDALEEDPAECFAIVGDVYRLAQDLSARLGLLGATVGAMAIENAALVGARCAEEADVRLRTRIAGALDEMRLHDPPISQVFVFEALFLCGAALSGHEEVPWVPTSGRDLDRLLERPTNLEMVEHVLDELPAWRALPDAYERASDEVERLTRLRTSSGNALLSVATPNHEAMLERVTRSRARMALLIEGLDRRRRVADPFGGGALHWRTLPEGGARGWSRGADLEDDGGDERAEADGPDVVVLLPALPTEAGE